MIAFEIEAFSLGFISLAQHSDAYIGNGATKEYPVLQEVVQEKDKVSDPER
jgi:hypothetical protein